jgi:hypothetical protein
MPQKITMSLNNNNSTSQYIASMNHLQKTSAAAAAKPVKNGSLKTPMIGRIHNVRPGCGSCGK